MKFGLTEDGKFYTEFVSCSRPVGNMRQELELACQRISSESKIMISLSSGLDSQVILHTFATMGLPYECAFMHHPGYNDIELKRIGILEKKYGFKANIVTIDPIVIKDTIEHLAEETGVPPQHHITEMFFKQIPETYNIVEGLENPDLYLEDGKWMMLESYRALDTTAAWFHKNRPNKIIHLDRRSEHYELALSMVTDDIAKAYRHSYPFIRHNGLVDGETHERPLMYIWGWTHYIKPIQYGVYWKDELIYFPKFAVQQQVDYLVNPKVTHDYFRQAVAIELDPLIKHLSDWGSGKVLRFTQS